MDSMSASGVAAPASPADRKAAAWLVLVGFLLLVPFHHGYFQSSDEVAIFEVTRSLTRGSISTPKIMYSYPGRGGTYYSQYQLGQSILALPFYLLGAAARYTLPAAWQASLAGPRRFSGPIVYGGSIEIFFVGLYSCFVTGVLLAVFFWFERELGVSRRNAVVASLLLGSTTYAATLSGYFLRHTTEAVMILGAFLCFYRFRVGGRRRDLAVGATLAALTPLVRMPAAVAGLGLGVHALWGILARSRGGRGRRLVELLPAVGLPLLAALGLHALGEWWKWEVPYLVPHETASFDHSLAEGLAAYLFSPGLSVFVYSPLLLLLPWTLPRFVARFRPEAVAILVTVACFLVVFSKFEMWYSGYVTVGPRYLFVAVPLLLLPLGPWLDRARGVGAWVATGVLGAAGLLVQFVLLTVDYGEVLMTLKYWTILPHGSFVFLTDARTPLLAMADALRSGTHIDPWLWNAFYGLDHVPAFPRLVVGIGVVWAACTSLAGVALWRAARSDAPSPLAAPASG